MADTTYREALYHDHCFRCRNYTQVPNDKCDECLCYPFVPYSSRPVNFVAVASGRYPFSKPVEKIGDYIYKVEYDKLDYVYAKKYYIRNDDVTPPGACSAFKTGRFVGRNLDWTYDDLAEFIVKTPAAKGRHAVIGVASGFKKLTKEFVDTHMYDDIYRVLPFQLYDGMNEAGLSASILVVPADHGPSKSVPRIANINSVNGLMLVRYILDNFSTAAEAVSYIRDYVEVWFSKTMRDKFGYELHYFVADPVSTYCLEFIGSQTVIKDLYNKPMVTNFYISGVEFNDDGTVYTPETQNEGFDAINTNHITPNGSGLERYNLILANIDDANNKHALRILLDKLKYSRAYNTSKHPSDPYWYTEFVGNGRTCASDVYDYKNAVETAGQMYKNRSRSTGLTWHTVHSSIYDLVNKKLYLRCQEDNTKEYGIVFTQFSDYVQENI